MLIRRTLTLLATVATLAFAAAPEAEAQGSESVELAQNNPVAIVAQVFGEAQIKHVEGDWRPAYWLDLLRPEDQIQTGADGKVVALFFFNNHLEVVDPSSEAKVAFKNVVASTGTVRAHRPKGRSEASVEIPYVLMKRLRVADFAGADDEGALDKEKIFLSGWVKNTAYPPVFYCKDMALPKYRFQIFNEWDEFLYEGTAPEPKWKYPYQGPPALTKNGVYYWQVLGPDDSIIVRKYPFRVLTQPLALLVERSEKQFDALVKKKQVTELDYTDLFLLYNTQRLLDKSIHLLQDMIARDPENPVLYRALVRAYLTRGCPAHAKETREKEIALGASDPIEK